MTIPLRRTLQRFAIFSITNHTIIITGNVIVHCILQLPIKTKQHGSKTYCTRFAQQAYSAADCSRPVCVGLYSVKQNPIDAIPDLSENQVIVFYRMDGP